jgi:hypothetical protein
MGFGAIPHLYKNKLAQIEGSYTPYALNLKLTIPKEDISKYTNFTISRK